jgi:hypothetical protein
LSHHPRVHLRQPGLQRGDSLFTARDRSTKRTRTLSAGHSARLARPGLRDEMREFLFACDVPVG